KKIDVHWIFVEGVQLTDLAKGPGHYPGTPLPGQFGNAAIAGHRTTHGAPFFNVGDLHVGDRIKITTYVGTYTYEVWTEPFAVDPTQYSVVGPPPSGLGPLAVGKNEPKVELTLTTCNPKYSASQRLIIKAR